MNVTNVDKTVLNSVEKLQYNGDECRVCLKKCNDVWQLFHRTSEDIPRKLMACAAVQVEEGDGLPTIICEICRRLLDVSYDFKCQVEQSDSRLREFVMLRNPVEDTKIMNLENSVDVSLTEVIGDEISQNRSSDDAVRCTELVNALVDPTEHIVTSLNGHHFAGDEEQIIFQIQPPSEQEDSVLEQQMNIENNECQTVDEKHLVMIEDCQRNPTVDTLIEKYDELRESSVDMEERPKTEAMDTDESEITEDESSHCTVENVTANEIVERQIRANEEAKDENYDSDDEEKPLINRTQRQKCPHCIKTFATKSALERHAEVHRTKLRYVCYMCDKQFPSIAKLKSHVLGSHDSLRNDEKTIVEDVTPESARTDKQQIARSESKKNLKFTCKICGKQFTYQKSFMTHSKSHTGYEPEFTNEKESVEQREDAAISLEESNERGNESEDDDMPVEGLQCTQCGKLFATKRNLKRHITTHSGLKFHCSTCGKEFSRIDKLKEHEQSKHNEELFASSDSDSDDDTDNENKNHDGSDSRKKEKHTRPHQCPMCPKAFAQEQSLTNHMERHKRVKDTQKRFLCEVCSKCFAQSGSLVAHMRTHTGVKPYVCNVCSRAFTKSTYLQLHLRTHSGEKPYICQYCSRAFARANTLARHITMHTGEAKYHCQICTKSFRRLTSLNEHTYTHTGQRPYACKICTKRYNNAGSLYAHTKKCKAQQLSGGTTTYTVPVDDNVHPNGGENPPMMIYSQRKLIDDTSVGQVTPSSQFMITNVHNNPSLKSLPNNIIPQFAVEDPNFCTVNKPYKNPYYTIYPNM